MRNDAKLGNSVGTGAAVIDKIANGEAFSFLYDGKQSQDILRQWKHTEKTRHLSDGTEILVSTYRDVETGVEASTEVTRFPGAPAAEFILYLRNTGTRDTGIFEKILPLNIALNTGATGEVILHYARGSLGKVEDYLPVDEEVASGTLINLTHYVLQGVNQVGGELPFFNLDWQRGGLIVAVGWSGQWAVRVSGETGQKVRLEAGQETTHLKLHPGETVRTPRILAQQWDGNDRLVGHNQFRRLLFEHYVPRINGQIVVPPVSNSDAFTYEYEAIKKKTGQNPLHVVSQLKSGEEQGLLSSANDALNWVNEKNQLEFIRGIPPVGIELYWLDAGWFPGKWPFGVGNWTADPKRFPHGLRPLSDAAHEKGLKFLLWFEPGRVGPGSAIAKQHPDWVLHRQEEGALGGLFNFGDPDALHWMTQTISARIDEWKVDIYRQDSNICPLLFWRTADAPDRQGVTENHWIEGLYAFWDSLLRAHPGLMIDNANWRVTGPDIEVMRRSVGSLTRSETECGGIPHAEATQLQTAELSLWVPITMGAANGFDPYTFRSAATNAMGAGLDLRAPYVPLNQVKRGIEEVKSLRPYWLGDYYPLSDIGLDPKAWAAWEFNRPDLQSGFAVFFRRPSSQQSTFETSLRGLDPSAFYDVTFAEDYDVKERRRMTGAQLAHLHVAISSRPGSLLVKYKITARTKR
jgi:alpha-galactosidase